MDVADASAGGRVVSVLEGGYDLQGLKKLVAAHVTALIPIEDDFLAVTSEAGLHEQLDIAVRVGAGERAAARPLASRLHGELLNQAESDVARVR